MPERCAWAGSDPLMQAYHDTEWGVPAHDDRHLFAMLVLEGAQAGLSWSTILKKRAAYDQAFAGFDPAIVAGYDADKVAALLADPGIVRNQLKVRAAITNAQALLRVQATHGSFDRFIWDLAGSAPQPNAWDDPRDIPTHTPESDAMSRALRALGFTFVGTTICYAFMQAVGMVNDHTTACFRWAVVRVLANVAAPRLP